MYHLWVYENGQKAALGFNIPSLLLSYDTRNGEWYLATLPATASALAWDGEQWVVVVAVPGQICTLDATRAYDIAGASGTLVPGDTWTTTTLTDASAAFPTAGKGLQGAPVWQLDAAGNVLGYRLVKSNTATQLTIFGTWPAAWANGMQYRVGDLQYYAEFDDQTLAPLGARKELQRWDVFPDPDSAANVMKLLVYGRYLEASDPVVSDSYDLNGEDHPRLAAADAGTRARALRLRLEGLTRRLVTVRGMDLVGKNINRD
jgi:hypothetical protein